MKLFLDSSDPTEIKEVCSWGFLSGVTTNPTLIASAGPDMQATLEGVVDASPGPVLVQAIGWSDPEPLMAQAKWLHNFSEKIVVKLPMSRAGLQALLGLKEEDAGIKLAVTMVSSVSQAYLCGKAGADIVAIFNGPLDQGVDDPVRLVKPVRKIYDNYGFDTQILSCGRFPRIFGQFAVDGTDICTMRIQYMRLLYEHSFTDARMNGFMKDWQSVFGSETWPEVS
jgi:transaldolase